MIDTEKICGANSSLGVLKAGHIGACFLELCITCPIHALLSAVSVFQLARYSLSPRRTYTLFSKLQRIAQFLSLGILLAVITQGACSVGGLQTTHSLLYYLSLAFIAFAWCLTSVIFWLKSRVPVLLCVLIFLSWGTTLADFSSVVLRTREQSINDEQHRIENYGVITRVALQTMIILVLIVLQLKWGSYKLHNTRLHAGIQAEPSETDKLLTSEDYQVYYSGISQAKTTSEELTTVDENSSFLSRLTFWWVYKLMEKGLRGKIEVPDDVFHLPQSLSTQPICKSFEKTLILLQKKMFKQKVKSSAENETEFSSTGKERFLLKALNKEFGLRYYSIGILKFLGDGLGFAGPLLLHALVSFMENKKEPMEHGYFYASGLFLATLIGSFISAHYGYQVNKVGLQIRAAVITSVYHKTLAVKSTGLFSFSTGEVVNFMSTDTDRIVNFCQSFHQFWSLPFQVAVSLYLLHQQVGLSFLAGLCFALLLIPVNKWLAVKIRKYSEDMMEKKDSRVKAMSEILYGIRVIKFYAWETVFSSKVHRLREDELKGLRGMKYLDAWCVYFWATTPVLISILTFCTYVLLGNTLTASKVFTSIALFNMLIFPLNVFPWVINGLIEAWVSLNRVNRFLILEELDWSEFYALHTIGRHKSRDSDVMVSISGGCFTWGDGKRDSKLDSGRDEDNGGSSVSESGTGHENSVIGGNLYDDISSNRRSLRNVNLTIYKGQLVGVIGKVGSGKSSLLSAITAEMDKVKGGVYVSNLNFGFGMASQEPWIQHASVKENILFGKSFDHYRYQAVLKACALEEDLKILPAQDETEVGENGVTLSGGQKSRIALARAVYQDKEIYLLDDPLAAVDTHVASHIFTQCIMGILKDKTRILCTHHRKYLQDADLIVVMEHGEIMCVGPPDEVLQKDIFTKQIASQEDDVDDELVSASAVTPNVEETKIEEDPGLVEEEEKDVGVVKYDVYRSYWLAAGASLTFSILLSLCLMQASRNISDWWLAYWISHEKSSPSANGSFSFHHGYLHHSTSTRYDGLQQLKLHVHVEKGSLTFYLVVYGGLAVANSIFTLFRAFLFAYGGVKAAQVIHEKLLTSIFAAPVSFFDVTPIGRVVNRFSSDTYAIDDSLPFMMNIFMAQLFGVAGTIAITCYGLPWFILVLIPLTLLYYKIQNYYRKTSREVKRLMTVSRSPVYAHFSETLCGLATIRALRATERFSLDNERKLEINQRANFSGLAASQWLSLNLQMLGVVMVTCVSFIAVLEHHFSSVDPGLVGLAISYALTITTRLSGLVTSFTETEKQMVSVERAMQYINGVPREVDSSGVPPLHWPNQGQVVFDKVSLIYRPGLPPALREISFETVPYEKIGIVGRTGSGKSSLFLVMFRMVSIAGGHVLIDGVDIASVKLQKLRSSLAIIPQDPFLFSDSVRKNVDPIDQYDDAYLWHVLERCNLKDVVRDLGGLQASVGEYGRNLSCGQRQLVCLARALLTRAKVLCIDEATASVDFETDKLIQKTIREEFQSSTVLTIAHRIDTILDSDRVLVLDKGRIAEFDTPAELLRNEQSLFSNLVNNG